MWALGGIFIDIAMHKRGPEDLPESRFLFALALACNLFAGLVYLSMLYPLSYSLVGVGVGAVWFFALLALALWMVGKPGRFLQTATAYLGVDTLFTLLRLPLPYWMKQDLSAEPALTLLVAIWFFLTLIWSLEVFGYILSRSLQVAYWYALGLVIFFFFSQVVVVGSLLPELPP